jgi:inner membrane protein
MAADLDFLFAAHRGPSHGLGAAALAGIVAFLATRHRRLSAAVVAAYASHTLLDWLGNDVAPPIGVMALWPFSREFYQSNIPIFHAISRRYWQPDFLILNLRAVAWEVVLLGPLTALIAFARRRRQYL